MKIIVNKPVLYGNRIKFVHVHANVTFRVQYWRLSAFSGRAEDRGGRRRFSPSVFFAQIRARENNETQFLGPPAKGTGKGISTFLPYSPFFWTAGRNGRCPVIKHVELPHPPSALERFAVLTPIHSS